MAGEQSTFPCFPKNVHSTYIQWLKFSNTIYSCWWHCIGCKTWNFTSANLQHLWQIIASAYIKHCLKTAGLVQLGAVPAWSSALPDHRSIYSSHLVSWAVCELSAASAIALLVKLWVKTNWCVKSRQSNDKSLPSTEGKAGKGSV